MLELQFQTRANWILTQIALDRACSAASPVESIRQRPVPAEKSVPVAVIDVLRRWMDTLLGDDSILVSSLQTLRASARSRSALQLGVLALRHQLQVLRRTRPRRLRLAKMDRWLWVVLSRVWTEWRRRSSS
jgi:hypothetical protein